MVQAAAPAKTRRSIVIGSGVILLLLLIGVSSWVWVQAHVTAPGPREQAIRFFAAIQAQDWKTVYALSEGAQRNFISEAAYERKMKATIGAPPASVFFAGLIGHSPTIAGPPVLHGNEATLPVEWMRTMSRLVDGKEYYQTATNAYAMKLKRARGIWMIADDPDGIGGLVALNYRSAMPDPGSEGGDLARNPADGAAPGNTSLSRPGGYAPPATAGSSLPPPAEAGQALPPAGSAAPAPSPPGNQAPAILEDRTRLGGPADNGGGNSQDNGSSNSPGTVQPGGGMTGAANGNYPAGASGAAGPGAGASPAHYGDQMPGGS